MEKYDIVSNFIRGQINNLPKKLGRKIASNKNKFNYRSEFYLIKKFIDAFLNDDDTYHRFFVLPGIRGVGKTTILFQIYDYLLKEKNIASNQILYISCEDLNNLVQCSVREMLDIFLNSQHDTNSILLEKKIFLLIDESQYDKNWALSGKILFDKSEDIFMIFTGSSTLNLEYNADAARRMVKKNIKPLNYKEHVKLKYGVDLKDLSDSLNKLLFYGDCDEAIKCESKANSQLINTLDYPSTDWDNYLKYGGFPHLSNEFGVDFLVNITNKVVREDMSHLKNFSLENQLNANRILRFLALQKPGEISQNKLSNYLQTSALNVKNILDVLEMTHLIFHTEPYSVSSKRVSKPWKYYFVTSSFKYALSNSMGDIFISSNEFEGSLLENLVASSLFNLSLDYELGFNVYYDARKKSNVDFLIQRLFQSPIPIEVGSGKKDKRQIKQAINYYDCDFGVVVSNKTSSIKKEGDIIFVPPKTFSFI